MAEVDIDVVLFDEAPRVDTYTVNPTVAIDGSAQGIFTWDLSSFYPDSGIRNPGLKIAYDHEAVSGTVPSKYFKSGIAESDSMEFIGYEKSIDINTAIDLKAKQGDVYLFNDRISVPSLGSVGISVSDLLINTQDSSELALSVIGIKQPVVGSDHYILDVSSPLLNTTIDNKWNYVNKFSGRITNGKELNTYIDDFKYRYLENTVSGVGIANGGVTDGVGDSHEVVINTNFGFAILKNTIKIACGADTWADDGLGKLSGTAGNAVDGTVNYRTGEFNLNWSPATKPANEVVEISYSYINDAEYIIVNLPEYSTTEEFGYKATVAVPVVEASVPGNYTIPNLLIDHFSGKRIHYDMSVADINGLGIIEMVAEVFSRTDIFKRHVQTTPSNPGEYRIHFTGTTAGSVDVYLAEDLDNPGQAVFYTDYPAYIVFNQDTRSAIAPLGATFETLDGYVINTTNMLELDSLTNSSISNGLYSLPLQHGGIGDSIRVFKYDTSFLTIAELTQVFTTNDLAEDEFRVDYFSGIVSLNLGGTNSYDIYAMYNYGPVGFVESNQSAEVLFEAIRLVNSISSNNNGYIILGKAPKDIGFIGIDLLSNLQIIDAVENIYGVDSDDYISIKVCIKSSAGLPVVGSDVTLVTDPDCGIEVLFSTGTTDSDGCIYMTLSTPPSNSFFIDTNWYDYNKISADGIVYFAKNDNKIFLSNISIMGGYAPGANDIIQVKGINSGVQHDLQYRVDSATDIGGGIYQINISSTLPYGSIHKLKTVSSLTVGSTITNTYTGSLGSRIIVPGSLIVTDDLGNTWTDNSAGVLVADGLGSVVGTNGTVTYHNGVFTVNYAAPATADISVSYQYYDKGSNIASGDKAIYGSIGSLFAATNAVVLPGYDTTPSFEIVAGFPDTLTIRKQPIGSYFNNVFIYKILANDMYGAATIDDQGSISGGVGFIIENPAADILAATQSITGHADHGDGTAELTVTGHGYSTGDVVIISNSESSYSSGVLAFGSLPDIEVTQLKTDKFSLTLDGPIDSTVGITITDTVNSVTWTHNNAGLMIPSAGPGVSGSVNYTTGTVILNYSLSVGVPDGTLSYNKIRSYDGAYSITVIDPNTLQLNISEYIDDVGYVIGGDIISVNDKYTNLNSATFNNGEISNITYGPLTFGDPTAVYANDYFAYKLLTTDKQCEFKFSVTDPFSGKIIESETQTLVTTLNSDFYGAFILDNNIISSGSYIL